MKKIQLFEEFNNKTITEGFTPSVYWDGDAQSYFNLDGATGIATDIRDVISMISKIPKAAKSLSIEFSSTKEIDRDDQLELQANHAKHYDSNGVFVFNKPNGRANKALLACLSSMVNLAKESGAPIKSFELEIAYPYNKVGAVKNRFWLYLHTNVETKPMWDAEVLKKNENVHTIQESRENESIVERKDTKGVEWPKEVLSRYGDITFKLDYAKSDRAKYEILDTETGKTWEQGGNTFGRVSDLEKYADNYIKPSGGRQSSRF